MVRKNPKSKYISISQLAELYKKAKRTIVDFSNEETGDGAKLQKEEMSDGRKKILNNEFNYQIFAKRFPSKKASQIVWNYKEVNQKCFDQINPTITEQLSFLDYLKSGEIPIRFPFKHVEAKNFYNNNKIYAKERKRYFYNHLEKLIQNSFYSFADTLNSQALQVENRNHINLFGIANGDGLRTSAILKKVLPKVLDNQALIQVFEMDTSRVDTKDVLFPIHKDIPIIEKKYKEKTEILIPLFSRTLQEAELLKVFETNAEPIAIADLLLEKDIQTSLNCWLLELEDLDEITKQEKIKKVLKNISNLIQNIENTTLENLTDQIIYLANMLKFIRRGEQVPFSYLQSFDIVNKSLNEMASLYSNAKTINVFTLLGTYLDELDYLEKLKTLTNLKHSLINPQDVVLVEFSIQAGNNREFMEKTKRSHLELYRHILDDMLDIKTETLQFEIEEEIINEVNQWKVVWTSPQNYKRTVKLANGQSSIVKITKNQKVVVDRYQPMDLEDLIVLVKRVGLKIQNISADSKCGSCVLVLGVE